MMQSGFTGTDFILRDYEDDESHTMSFIITHTAHPRVEHDIDARETRLIRIVMKPDSIVQMTTAEAIKVYIYANAQQDCEIMTIHDLLAQAEVPTLDTISLLEIDSPFLPQMQECEYNTLQVLLKKSKILVWATYGGGLSPQQPGSRMIDGFARSVRLENPKLKLVSLGLDAAGSMDSHARDLVKVMMRTEETNSYEHEYVEKDGFLSINRAADALELRGEFLARMQPQRKVQRPLKDLPPVNLTIQTVNTLDSLEFTPDSDGRESLSEDEVEITVEAVGLDEADYLVASGRSKSTSFGRDCAGTITRVGDRNQAHLGDRVYLPSPGKCSSKIRSDIGTVVLLPNHISFPQACALPRDYVAAAYALQVSRAQAGNTIVLNCIGTFLNAAISFGKELGLDIIVLAQNTEEAIALENKHQLGSDRIILATDCSKLRGPKTALKADIVLDTQSDPSCLDFLSSFGTYVNISTIEKFPFRDRAGENNTIVNINVDLLAQDPNIAWRLRPTVEKALTLASDLDSASIPCFSASEATQAFEFLASNEAGSKVVLTFDGNDIVQVSSQGWSAIHYIILTPEFRRVYHTRTHTRSPKVPPMSLPELTADWDAA
jgi:NADPH:quinone reductase-like Zn-dependent oxidoreductase